MDKDDCLDYDDVNVLLEKRYVSDRQKEFVPDLSFAFGELRAELPLVFYYQSSEPCEKMEKVCEANGVLTAGAVGSKIPLPFGEARSESDKTLKNVLFESFMPLSDENIGIMKQMKQNGTSIVAGCSVSCEHGIRLVNEHILADAILIGPTQSATTKRLEATGMTLSRVSMAQKLSFAIDKPVIATASSPADVCKALVAGASAALIHFGGPFQHEDDLDFVVKAACDSLRETLTDMCLTSGAKNVYDLGVRYTLVPKR